MAHSVMDNVPDRSSRNTAGVLLLLVPLLYVLSSGPVVFVLVKWSPGPAYNDVVNAFYAPLAWLHDHTPLQKPLASYVDWWGDMGGLHRP